MATRGINFALDPPYVNNASGIAHSIDKINAMPAGWTPNDYTERFSRRDSYAEMTWIGPWSSRWAFRDWAMGDCKILGQGGGQFLSRTIPAQHPEDPSLYCVDCDLVEAGPMTALSNTSIPQLATGAFIPAARPLPMVAYVASSPPDQLDDGACTYRLRYAQLNYEVRTDNEMQQLARTGVGGGEINRHVERFQTYQLSGLPISKLVGAQLFFTAGPYTNVPIPEAGVLPLWGQELRYVWHDVPSPPEAVWSACINCVNSAAFDSAGLFKVGHDPYPPGTLLMQSPTKERHRLQNGRVVWTVTYAILFRPQGHNSFPAADGNIYPAALFGPPQAPLAPNQPGVPLGNLFKSFAFDGLFVTGPAVVWQ